MLARIQTIENGTTFPIGGFVLVGGQSRRMGRNKALAARFRPSCSPQNRYRVTSISRVRASFSMQDFAAR